MQHRDRVSQVSLCLLAALALARVPTKVQAQVVPDGTLGNGNNSVTSTTGNRTNITGGAGRGAALFHSFQQFNISPNEQVYFANPANIRNIFSRVTGGSISNINGLLGVAGSANLFFMNPNGIIFGPNARLDVSGSFLATTANALEFPDGQTFAATGDRAVPLVEVNVPIGLQFGANPPAMLTNRGNLAAGKNLTLAAGNLDLQGQLQAGENLTLNATDTVKIRDTVTEPFVAQAGNKLLIQGDQQVDTFALNHPSSGLISSGDTVLRSANTVVGDAHYFAGGDFRIEQLDGNLGNLFSPNDPVIRASGNVTFANYDGLSLHILAGGSVTITGNVTIRGADPTNGLPDESVPLAIPLPDGTTRTDVTQIKGRSEPTLDIRAGTLAFGTPTAATPGSYVNLIPGIIDPVTLTPTPVTLTDRTSSDITIGRIKVRGDLVTDNGVQKGAGQVFLTNRFRPNLALNNGAIRVNGQTVDPLIEQADPAAAAAFGRYSIFAFGLPVTIAARGDAQVTGGIVTGSTDIPGGNIQISSGSTINVSGGRLFSQTSNNNSGNIRLEALGEIKAGVIDTRVTGTTGNAGDVRLSAVGNISTNNSNIISQVENGATGTGGDVSIISRNGSITNIGNIESSTANGTGGLITIQANGDIQAGNVISQVRTGGTGRGGDITITSLNGAVRNLGTVESSTPNGDGGGLTVRHGGDIIIRANGGSIEASAIRSFVGTIDTVAEATGGIGNAGSITLNASGIINVLGRTQSFTGTGNGGSISFTTNGDINAGAIRSFVGTISNDLVTTTGGTGSAGEIKIQSTLGGINVSSDISAFSGTDNVSADNSGNVTLIATDTIRTRDIRTYIGNSDSTGKVTGGTGNPGAIKITLNSSNPNAEIDTTQGSLSSAGPLKGGDITLESTGNLRSIKTANVTSQATANVGNADGGKIVFDSKGSIDTSRGTLNSEGSDDGGSIQLTANGNIVTGSISSISPGALGFGGPISLTSNFGGINTVAGTLTSEGFLRGGSVTLLANQDIAANSVISRSTGSNSGTGGSLTFTSQNGKINTSLGTLNSQGGQSGGNVSLTARQNIDAGNIFSTSEGRGFSIGTGGKISINSGANDINIVDRIISSRASGNANGGDISIDANGSINIVGKTLITAETTGGNSGKVTIQSNGGNLTFVGDGNPNNDLGAIKTTVNPGATGSGGDITIASNGGQINFSNGFQVNAATNTTNPLAEAGRGGDVSITSSGGQITVGGGTAIDASTSGVQTGGNVTILSGNQSIQLNSGSISTTVKTGASGNGGSIKIQSNGNDISLGANGSFAINAATEVNSNGQGGNVDISTGGGQISLVNNSVINASTNGAKAGGSVALTSGGGNINLGSGGVTTTVGEQASGNGGDIAINSNGGLITLGNADTNTSFQVNAQTQATNTIGNAQTNGKGGNVSIASGTGDIALVANSSVTAGTTGTKDSGAVTVTGANIGLIGSGSVGSQIQASSTGSGDAGKVTVTGAKIGLIGSQIQANSTGSGGAGNVVVTGTDISLAGSRIQTNSTGSRGAGDVAVTGADISLAGSQIQAKSTGLGSAGEVSVTGADISLVGGTSSLSDSSNRSEISTSATGQGAKAGDVTLSAVGHSLTLQNSDVLASSKKGTSGNVSITARRVDLKNGTIKAETGQNTPESATGSIESATGSIKLDLSFRLTLEDESEISTLGKKGANGGDIRIENVRFLFGTRSTGPNGSNIVGRADGGGQGGKVFLDRSTLVAGFVFRKAVDGNRTNDIDTNGQLQNFSTDADVASRGLSTPLIAFTDVSQLNKSACEAVGAKAAVNSELRITGQGGVTLSPTAPLPAQPTSSDWVSLDVSPQVQTNVTFSNGATVTLQPGQTYQVQATCVKSWKEQQRSLL